MSVENISVVLVAGSPLPIDYAMLKAALKSASLTIAVDGGGKHFAALGCIPDVLIGDLDSLTLEIVEDFKKKEVKIYRASADKNVSDLELALEYLGEIELGEFETLIFGALGGRLDHELVVLGDCARHADLLPMLLSPERSAYFLSSQGRSRINLTGYTGTVSVISLSKNARVSEVGMKWNLELEQLDLLSGHGLSNLVDQSAESSFIEITEGVVAVLCEK